MRRRDYAAIDWENVIDEIARMAWKPLAVWQANCEWAIEVLMCYEHCVDPTNAELRMWRRELGASRRAMARELRRNPGMEGELEALFTKAWTGGRDRAAAKLELHDRDSFPVPRCVCRIWKLVLPGKCPYTLAETAGYDPFGPEPGDWDDWALPPRIGNGLERQIEAGLDETTGRMPLK